MNLNLYTILLKMYHLTKIKICNSNSEGLKIFVGSPRELQNQFGYSRAKDIQVIMIDTHYSTIILHTLEKS